MKRTTAFLSLCLVMATAAHADDIERGRYLVSVGGCNDCHTAQFAETGGQIPETQRLIGVPVGFSGPWGVSYPANLRLTAARQDEDAWMVRVRAGGLPPMPWTALQAMTDADLRSVYRYLRHLGPAGDETPAALQPGAPIPTPHFVFVPQAPTTVGMAAPR